MSILAKLSGFWRRQGIAPKFGLAFVLLINLCFRLLKREART